MNKKTLSYFMRAQEEKIVSIPAPMSFTDDEGNALELKVKVLPAKQIREIYEKYTNRSFATDKKGAPYIVNGEVVFKTIKDNLRASRHIVAEAIVEPDLKSKEIMDFYKCVDISEIASLVFATQDEYLEVMRGVFRVLGIGGEVGNGSMDDDIEAAKN